MKKRSLLTEIYAQPVTDADALQWATTGGPVLTYARSHPGDSEKLIKELKQAFLCNLHLNELSELSQCF